MYKSPFAAAASEQVWRNAYRWSESGHMQEPSIEASWDRVALAVSGVEPNHRNDWRERFRAVLGDFRFLPGGRILAGAGTPHQVTLLNGFVMGALDDSINGIFNALREAMLTLQAGGGIGIDFSTLRPAGSAALRTGGEASGPVAFMRLWEAANAVPGKPRRSAMMATLRCDHPDIEAFAQSSSGPSPLHPMKLSVLLSEAFMHAVDEDSAWPLVFPLGDHLLPAGGEVCERVWSGSPLPQPCRVYRRVPARLLWDHLLQAMHRGALPGVLFVDRINRVNNLWFSEHISCSSPCAALPLPAFGACNLGSINLTRFVQHPFGPHPDIDFAGLRAVAAVATRFLDDVIDLSLLPLKSQEKVSHGSRRIGLGVTGLADTLLMLGLRYGSPGSLELARQIIVAIRDTAYRTSVALAQEKGACAAFDKVRYGASPFVLDLPHDIQDGIALHGIRNSHLLAVAPAASISLLANNVSRGIEPVLEFRPQQGLRQDNSEVSVEAQLRMAEAVQSCVDNAVSKTVRLPQATTAQEIGQAVQRAWELGLKGCSFHREGSSTGAVAPNPLPVTSRVG
jgi:ribonucleoside-diphosphate reductase alpha chain